MKPLLLALASTPLLVWTLGCSTSTSSGSEGGTPTDRPTLSESILDIGELSTSNDLLRVHGYTGRGELGLPVAAGGDCDGDGLADVAFASFLASPFDRARAGEAYLVFGDGTTTGLLDAATQSPRVLRIAGSGQEETLG
ncbi:MAG: hypothetical protein WBG86_01455, partial [Polyangiales bacterium]